MDDARSRVVAKALKDPAFRAALLEDANAAVAKELGLKLPDGLKIKVVEDSAAAVHLVLPPASKTGELSDADLERVAGGDGPPTYACLMDSTHHAC